MNKLGLEVGQELNHKEDQKQKCIYKVMDVFPNSALIKDTFIDDTCIWSNDEIEKYLVVPKKKWQPKFGEKYWRISSSGESYEFIWSDGNIDLGCLKFGNCFQTEAECEAAAEKVRELLNSLK